MQTATIPSFYKKALLTDGASNLKMSKDKTFLSYILHLSPHKLSGKNLCSMAHRTNLLEAISEYKAGRSVTIIVNGIGKNDPLPWRELYGIPIIDGDKSDNRFMHQQGIVVLRMKRTPFDYTQMSQENILDAYNGKQAKATHCFVFCLNTAGKGRFDNVQNRRMERTDMLLNDKAMFRDKIYRELRNASTKASKMDKEVAIRLNGTSDVMWERVMPELFQDFPHVHWYDYTKIPGRQVPDNYHLTYSLNHVYSADDFDLLCSLFAEAA